MSEENKNIEKPRPRKRVHVEKEFQKIKRSQDCQVSKYDGDCCCNCKNLVLINKHPLNYTSYAKGSNSKSIAYGCVALYEDEENDKIRKITFSDNLHGMCELHMRNK